MHLRPLVVVAAALFSLPVVSRAAEPPPAPSAVQIERADKIAAGLGLSDPAQATRVRDLIAGQYRDLSLVHDTRDAALKAAKESTDNVAAAKDTTTARMADLHYAYLAALSAELNPEQVEQVKDGMTYGVVPLTFRVYQEMLPDLSAEQKRKLLAWLREAREHAMDAGSSDEKHGWFGKYKGRINNYLSTAGIDMKKAEHDMMERKKAAPAGK